MNDVEKELHGYVREVRRAARVRRAPSAPTGAPAIEAHRLLWHRLRATHAAERLGPGAHARAAHGGLQDSVPRAGLLALHARVEQVTPEGWEHPDLAQVWLRWADHIVPRADVAVFTIGALPRERAFRRALDRLALATSVVVEGGHRRTDAAAAALGLTAPTILRCVAVTGRFAIRWDARTTELVPIRAPDVDGAASDRARQELARRFLHWYGPVTCDHLARWSGTTRDDASRTWAHLQPEMAPVAIDGRERWVLRDDLDTLLDAAPPIGVRLLPAGDPCLFVAEDLDAAPDRPLDAAAGVTPRLRNSLTGRIVVDGRIVGSWGRVGTRVTLDPWSDDVADRTEGIGGAAAELAGPIGAPVDVRWLAP